MYLGSTQGALKKIINVEVVLHTKYTGIELSVENQKEVRNRSYIKMGNNFKKCKKYKSGDRYCLLCMEEKLEIASYNNPCEFHNLTFEILNICKYKKACHLGKQNLFGFFKIFMLIFYCFW